MLGKKNVKGLAFAKFSQLVICDWKGRSDDFVTENSSVHLVSAECLFSDLTCVLYV